MIRGKQAEAERVRSDQDAFSAVQCLSAARLAGNKGAKIEDFMIFRKKGSAKTEVQPPEEFSHNLGLWVTATGGHKIYG